MELLTKNVPVLSDIVVFGSACTVHVNPKNKSLVERGKTAIIIGKSDETKGYKGYISKYKVVVVTQHERNIETLTDQQNEQLMSCLEKVGRQEELHDDGQPDIQVHPSAKKRAIRGQKGRRSRWTR